MQQSQEVRWFVPESLPDEVKKWRDERPAPFKDEERTDTYLRQRREDQGIKLRAGERIEVKFRVAELGNLRFLGGFEGLAERWLKLSLVLDSGSADEEINDSRWWVDVSKRRRVWTYEVSGEGVHLAASDRTLPGARTPYAQPTTRWSIFQLSDFAHSSLRAATPWPTRRPHGEEPAVRRSCSRLSGVADVVSAAGRR